MTVERRPLTLLFGGTFDPIHNGHVNMLWQASWQLQADSARVLPCHNPPHRPSAKTPPEHRLAMLQLVVDDLNNQSQKPIFELDTQEFEREQLSYTLDTLKACRQRWGQQLALVWLMGGDSWEKLYSWRNYQSLTDYAHIAIVGRPGFNASLNTEQANWSREKFCSLADIRQQAYGRIVQLDTLQLPIASVQIREQIAAGSRPVALVPSVVNDYIQHHGLYLSSH